MEKVKVAARPLIGAWRPASCPPTLTSSQLTNSLRSTWRALCRQSAADDFTISVIVVIITKTASRSFAPSLAFLWHNELGQADFLMRRRYWWSGSLTGGGGGGEGERMATE